MGKPGSALDVADRVRVFAQFLQDRGVPDGARIDRGEFEDWIRWSFGVSSRQSIADYIHMGKAGRLWLVEEAHGKGGRGKITFRAGS